jgi:hypothetical protein
VSFVAFLRHGSALSILAIRRRKEAADEKIKEMLRLFVTTPQTKVIYFGGGHDSGYGGSVRARSCTHRISQTDLSALSHYQNLGFEDKIVILKGYAEIAYDLRNLSFRAISSDGLFMQEKIDLEPLGNGTTPAVQTSESHNRGPPAPSSNQSAPAAPGGSYATAAGTLPVPGLSPTQRAPSPGHLRRTSRGGQRRIDPSKVRLTLEIVSWGP